MTDPGGVAPVTGSREQQPSTRPVDRLGPPLLVLLGIAVALRPGFEHDVWWHLASGRWMVQERAWLREDVFTWTQQGEPWVRPGLLADIGLYGAFSAGGAPLVRVLTAAFVLVAFWLVWRRLSGPSGVRVVVLAVALLAVVVAVVPRPLVVSVTLTAAFVVILDREREGPTGWLWALPLLSAVWVNVHGAFLMGLILIGVHGLATVIDAVRASDDARQRHLGQLRRLAAVGFASAAALLVNPFGWRVVPYAVETVQLRVLGEFVHEWRQPTPTDVQFVGLFALVAVTVYALVRAGRRADPADVLLLVALGGLALTAARHAALFAVAAPIPLTRLLGAEGRPIRRPVASWREAPRGQRRLDVAVLVVATVVVGALVAPTFTAVGNDRATRELIAVDALDQVARGELPDRVWNSYAYGGYLIWAGWPEVLVSIDSRTDLYGDVAVREHVRTWSAEGDVAIDLTERDVHTVVVERHAPIAAALEAAGWHRRFDDGLAVVLTAGRERRVTG